MGKIARVLENGKDMTSAEVFEVLKILATFSGLAGFVNEDNNVLNISD